MIEATLQDASPRGEGLGISAVGWAGAVRNNGLGRYAEALTAARRGSENHPELGHSNWAMAELIEAAARSGMTEIDARRLPAAGRDDQRQRHRLGLGIQARSRAAAERRGRKPRACTARRSSAWA